MRGDIEIMRGDLAVIEIGKLVLDIKCFNPEFYKISRLRDLLQELKTLCRDLDDDPQHYIDMSSLPTRDVEKLYPSVDVGYPIWSMDYEGNCLVGQGANDIEHISEICEYYTSKKESKNVIAKI